MIRPSRLRTGFGENRTWDTTSRWFDGTLAAGIEISYRGTIVVVSHDRRFLERLGTTRELRLPL